MPLNMNMTKVYEFMQPVGDALNRAYDYAVEFTDGLMESISIVITVFS